MKVAGWIQQIIFLPNRQHFLINIFCLQFIEQYAQNSTNDGFKKRKQ